MYLAISRAATLRETPGEGAAGGAEGEEEFAAIIRAKYSIFI